MVKKNTAHNGTGKLNHRAAKPASLRALADYLGLSPATISVVLNNSPVAKTIAGKTKARILEAARKFEYRPNFYARSLSLKRNFTVGVLVPEISEGYAASIMSGIEGYLQREGYFYFVACHRTKTDLVETYPQMLVERAVEGLILVNTPLLRAVPVPTVSVSHRQKVKGVTNILVNNEHAAHMAMEHLVRLGHRRIAFFKGHPGSADTVPRWRGICHAAESLGIEVRPELTIQLQGDTRTPEPSIPEEGFAYAKKLLARGEKFTALFAFNDISAIGAVRAFSDAGLRVPQDVSVVGFDDVPAAAYLTPRLTTVRQPLHEMGELAAKKLLERISNGGHFQKEIRVEPELVVRESTQAPPQPEK